MYAVLKIILRGKMTHSLRTLCAASAAHRGGEGKSYDAIFISFIKAAN